MSSETEILHQQIYAMSNTIEALKRRCIELEFQIIDHMAANIASNHTHEELTDGSSESELSDGVAN